MLTPRRPAAAALAAREPVAPRPSATDSTEALQSLKAEIAFLHDMIVRNKRDLTSLMEDGSERRFARAGEELGAATDAMRGATDIILSLAETADDSARTLAASLTDDFKRGLAQDIQEQIVKIYEACNFQDIAGQHIAKVSRMLATVEEQIDAVLARSNGLHVPAPSRTRRDETGLLNGPKVAGDNGHATQGDVDRIFAHG